MTRAIYDGIVYKYKWRFLPLAWLALSMSFCIALGVVWIIRQGWQGGVSFLLISLSCSALMCWALLLGLADIYVNDVEIAKKAFGLVVQRTRWNDIEELRITMSKSQENGLMVRSFAFRSKLGNVSLFSWIIVFQERRIGMDALIDKVMNCARTYRLRIVDLSQKPPYAPR